MSTDFDQLNGVPPPGRRSGEGSQSILDYLLRFRKAKPAPPSSMFPAPDEQDDVASAHQDVAGRDQRRDKGRPKRP